MSFQQALSGLNAAAKNLDVIGHNIANSGTVGFKSSRTEFAEAMASAAGSASGQTVGIGVNVGAVTQQFKQGNINATGNSLDVAINGEGFFVVRQPDGSMAYTRAGNFGLDKAGDLKTLSGDNVMGYQIDTATGKIMAGAMPVPMSFPSGQPIAAKQTSKVNVSLNLDARAYPAAGDATATPPVAATPRATYGTSLNVYDEQGAAIPVSLFFEKSDANQWTLFDKLDDTTSTPPKVNPPLGFVQMDSAGVLQGVASTVNKDAEGFPTTLKYEFYDSAEPDPMKRVKTLDITRTWTYTRDVNGDITSATYTDVRGAATPTGSTALNTSVPITVDGSQYNSNGLAPFQVDIDMSGLTQFGTKFAVSNLNQDGYTAGVMTGIAIGGDGSIVATYSNGVSRAEGMLTLASFRNPQGLAATGDNKWVETDESGLAVNGQPKTGTLGSLQAGALEDSNVDLTAELVNMMTAQRAYQSSAQAIKTQDQVFSTLVNLR